VQQYRILIQLGIGFKPGEIGLQQIIGGVSHPKEIQCFFIHFL
jgi:hypothetical protein